MRCIAGIDLHACVCELTNCLNGAVGSQICHSGATMPDRMFPLLAANRLASATALMFSLPNRTRTKCSPPYIGVTEPFLVPVFDSLLI
jgi:hypothetical protein